MRFKKTIAIVALVASAVGLAACDNLNQKATTKDSEVSNQILSDLQKTQPVPRTRYSQLRQNLIEIEKAQTDTTSTTSFFMLEGVPQPVSQCASIGYPIPTTFQLTNPDQMVGGRNGGHVTVAQLEANGVYTGDSSGTYVICINSEGKAYAQYWEGYVMTVTGQAKFANGQVQIIGSPSANFSAAKQP